MWNLANIGWSLAFGATLLTTPLAAQEKSNLDVSPVIQDLIDQTANLFCRNPGVWFDNNATPYNAWINVRGVHNWTWWVEVDIDEDTFDMDVGNDAYWKKNYNIGTDGVVDIANNNIVKIRQWVDVAMKENACVSE